MDESADWLAAVAQAVPIGLAAADRDGAIVAANPSCAGLLPLGEPVPDWLTVVSPRACAPNGRLFDVSRVSLADGGTAYSLRDVTEKVGSREKMIAIQRAGRELSHLTPDELARMTVADRIDLLKANILQYSREILRFRNLEVRLLDESGRLDVLLSEGTPGGVNRELFANETDNGITGYVAATGRSYLLTDVDSDPHYLPGMSNGRSSLTVPILDHDRIVGTFNVESDEPNHFTESDREFLEVFARAIATALATLQLLQLESRFGRVATVEAIVNEVSLPADTIAANAIRVLEALKSGGDVEESQRALRQILHHARSVKAAIQRIGRPETVGKNEDAGGPAEVARFAGLKVLLVDSDPQIRRTAHRLLGKLGCEVDTAGDGREALALARAVPFDVAIADIRLPDMNGCDIFRALRRDAPQTAIVLMTGFGYDGSHSLVNARSEGLRSVLYKPFRTDRLIEAVRDAIKYRPTLSDSEPTK